MQGRELKYALVGNRGQGGGVAPHAGARIEMASESCFGIARCVAPHAGARIEICYSLSSIAIPDGVAPHAGARIEIVHEGLAYDVAEGRPSRRGEN